MHNVINEEGYPVAMLPTLLGKIEGSIDSNQYRKLYIEKDGQVVDVIGNGRFACAYYVSSVLTLFNLINNGVHTNVVDSIRDLLAAGWYTIPEPRDGAVVV